MKNYIENFYQQAQIPLPQSSPEQRRQIRYGWRNERTLYHRNCDLTGQSIIAMYPQNSPFPVYKLSAWLSDNWDPLEYGQEFDFSRPFFEQFFELQQKVPRMANILTNTENCDYCNVVGDSKNCYLIFGSVYCEDCLYGNPYYSKNCIDSLVVRNSELCYECIDCDKLYECFYCQNCTNSQNLWFCDDLSASRNCFLCIGLKNAEYQIMNEQYSKEEYELKITELKQNNPQELRKKLLEFKTRIPLKFMVGYNNENVTGDHIYNSKDCSNIFHSQECRDAHNCTQIMKSHDLVDTDFGEFGEFLYENSGFYKCSNLFCCHWCWEVSNLYYCSICTQNTRDCFGCISLRHKQYCILNNQYSKEQYEQLLPKIIEHMQKTGEWGLFFPLKYSPFAYNETVANEYYPLNREEVITKGWNWNDSTYIPPSNTQNAIKCPITNKFFKLTPQESTFYKRYRLPNPKYHPDQRHKIRLSMRNPQTLIDSNCSNCKIPLKTTYPKESSQAICCEKCYQNLTY